MRAFASVVVLVALSASCDWRKFDDIKAGTPVLSLGASGAFGPTDDFGRYVLSLAAPAAGATGGRFVVSAASAGALALTSIDATGKVTTVNKSDLMFGGEEITSLAEVPGGKQLLLGAHQGGPNNFGAAYVLTIADLKVTLLAAPPADGEFGLAVAAGALTGAATPDFAVLSADQLTVFPGGAPTGPVVAPPPPADCPLALTTTRDRANRVMLIEDLKGAGAAQIVVGTPTAVGQGAVVVFDVDPTTGVASCAFAYRNAAARFGQAIATGDFDADGKRDLLIGAPPEGAFWIRGPLTATSPILPVTLAKGPSGGQLGFAVGAGDLDGVAGDEALVGDPDAKVDGKLQAGEVRIVGGALLDHEQPVVRRHAPDATDAFGVQVGVLPFCTSACGTASAKTQNLLLVGSRTRVFTFFVLDKGDLDPRTP